MREVNTDCFFVLVKHTTNSDKEQRLNEILIRGSPHSENYMYTASHKLVNGSLWYVLVAVHTNRNIFKCVKYVHTMKEFKAMANYMERQHLTVVVTYSVL